MKRTSHFIIFTFTSILFLISDFTACSQTGPKAITPKTKTKMIFLQTGVENDAITRSLTRSSQASSIVYSSSLSPDTYRINITPGQKVEEFNSETSSRSQKISPRFLALCFEHLAENQPRDRTPPTMTNSPRSSTSPLLSSRHATTIRGTFATDNSIADATVTQFQSNSTSSQTSSSHPSQPTS